MKKQVAAILTATCWISASEFIRNEFLLKGDWVSHYANLGLLFPAEPVNGALWVTWSLAYAVIISILSTRFTPLQTTGLAWLIGFVLMWLVLGNLLVLPLSILPLAIPLSILEAWIATVIIFRIQQPGSQPASGRPGF